MTIFGPKTSLLPILILLFMCVVISGCTKSDIGLSGGESEGSIYVGGFVNLLSDSRLM